MPFYLRYFQNYPLNVSGDADKRKETKPRHEQRYY